MNSDEKFDDLMDSFSTEKQEAMLNNQFPYIFSKADQFLQLGADAYREEDFFKQPPNKMSEEDLEILQLACKQIIEGKGFDKNNPLTGLGVSGFYDVMRLFHFKSKSRKTFYQFQQGEEKGALDCITFQHRVDGREATLYNFCPFTSDI
jgi:hypothetical protein